MTRSFPALIKARRTRVESTFFSNSTPTTHGESARDHRTAITASVLPAAQENDLAGQRAAGRNFQRYITTNSTNSFKSQHQHQWIMIKQLVVFLAVGVYSCLAMGYTSYISTGGGPYMIPVDMPVPFVGFGNLMHGGGGGGGGHGGYGKSYSYSTGGGPIMIPANDVIWAGGGHGY